MDGPNPPGGSCARGLFTMLVVESRYVTLLTRSRLSISHSPTPPLLVPNIVRQDINEASLWPVRSYHDLSPGLLKNQSARGFFCFCVLNEWESAPSSRCFAAREHSKLCWGIDRTIVSCPSCLWDLSLLSPYCKNHSSSALLFLEAHEPWRCRR